MRKSRCGGGSWRLMGAWEGEADPSPGQVLQGLYSAGVRGGRSLPQPVEAKDRSSCLAFAPLQVCRPKAKGERSWMNLGFG